MVKLRIVITLGLLICGTALWGEVFTLKPGGGGFAGFDPLSVPTEVWNEPIQLNGYQSELSIEIFHNTMQDLIFHFKRQYPNAVFKMVNGVCVAEIKIKGEKFRCMMLEQDRLILFFKMRVPHKLPNPSWPRALPDIPNATPVLCTEFPNRKTVSMQFSMSGTVEHNNAAVARSLQAKGWLPVSSSERMQQEQGGSVYLSQDGSQMLIVGLQSNFNNTQSVGSMILNKLKK